MCAQSAFLAYTRKSFIDISNSGLYLYFGEPPGSACMRVGNAEFYYCLSQPALVGFIRILDNKYLFFSVSRRKISMFYYLYCTYPGISCGYFISGKLKNKSILFID